MLSHGAVTAVMGEDAPCRSLLYSLTDAGYAVQDGSKFWIFGYIQIIHDQINATEQHFPVVLFIMLYN